MATFRASAGEARPAEIGTAFALVTVKHFQPCLIQRGKRPMNKTEMRDAILEAKKAKGMSWEAIAAAAGLAPEYVVSACLGMNHLDKANASYNFV